MSDVVAAGGLIRASLQRSGKWATSVAFIGGVISDILNPLAPFAAYLFLASAVGALILLIALVTRRLMPTTAVPAMVFAVAVAAVSGAMYYFQQANDAKDGALAELVPAIGKLQASLGLVAKDVGEIKEGVARVETGVGRVEGKVGEVKQEVAAVRQDTGRIVQTLEEMAGSFANLTRSGGLVAEPRTPAEFYHNARTLEARGDGAGARRAYLALAGYDPNAIDPWLRLATLLRVQDGRAGAREIFAGFEDKARSGAFRLVSATLHDDAERRRRIETIAAENPADGPAAYLAAQEVSEARLGAQTLGEKRAEQARLARFLEAETRGELAKRFLDPAMLGEWLDLARKRSGALAGALAAGATEPSATFMRAGNGWMATVQLPEPATAMSYRLGDSGDFTPAGTLQMIDQRTGRPMLNPAIPIASGQEPPAIFVTYADLRGAAQGPFRISFDPESALVGQMKQMGELTRTSWLAFGQSNGTLLYFTQLVSIRCGVREIRIGIGRETPDRTLDLPACDPKNPYAIPSGLLPFLRIGDDVGVASAEITWKDGAKSGVQLFRK